MIAADNTYTNGVALPPGDSPELILVPATPAEKIEALKLNSIAWKGRLDTETYIARENHLHSQQLVKDDLTSWILVDRSEPEGERTILSSCETYKKKAWLAHNGRVEDVSTHGIGSVYCRPQFRGKGYAKRMMEELSKKVDTWNMESESRKKALFSILYSDIGKNFYAQFGWKPFLSSHFALPPVAEEHNVSNGVEATMPQVKTLTAEDVRTRVCNKQILAKERESLRLASMKTPTPKIAIAPDYNHLRWHWAREEFFVKSLFPGREAPTAKGAGDDAAGVHCAWNRNFGSVPEENTLYILRWVYEEPTSPEETKQTIQAMAAILRRAQREAHEWDMSTVEFWNPTPLLQQAVAMVDPNVELVHRQKDSIASLRWNGAESGFGETVEWCLNEKYAWC
ncbi:uncharacterized protein BP01DRAFT_358149 [Aspergillus saccharolyticus JOP 1030-1]|uniref:GNAT family acetyltransferase n=1 Tax=Aspergillus saccharolyticus JOP 1030-1 TaxID=1450539 RepID=A0A318ZBT1_9EURO|nr:GNAT family acetyltransferase [Aspergillus saccharolyticus JOP 1030-1]PYH43977.1 GNAT family acetyltransferase [Aspergillus saccharolyticus JOP 1030-1]